MVYKCPKKYIKRWVPAPLYRDPDPEGPPPPWTAPAPWGPGPTPQEWRCFAGVHAQLLRFEDAAHDLAAPGLGEFVHELDILGLGNGPEGHPHMVLEVQLVLVARFLPQLEDDKGFDEVALGGVGLPEDRGLCHRYQPSVRP